MICSSSGVLSMPIIDHELEIQEDCHKWHEIKAACTEEYP